MYLNLYRCVIKYYLISAVVLLKFNFFNGVYHQRQMETGAFCQFSKLIISESRALIQNQHASELIGTLKDVTQTQQQRHAKTKRELQEATQVFVVCACVHVRVCACACIHVVYVEF